VLENVIKQMLQPIKNVPLYLIIESICGHKVLRYDNFEKQALVKAIEFAAQKINEKGIKSNRPNEVGNYAEPYIIKAFRQFGYSASIPRTPSKQKRSVGYPDIFVSVNGRAFYIECKTYNIDNVDTTQRSFYLSPNKDFKVTQDAYHIIFAFSIVRTAPGIYKTSGMKILDARDLLCDVKYEFNADNRRMYGDRGLDVIYQKKL
jgi:hypothetical protein